MSSRIKLGLISAPHGVRGQIKIRSFTASPRDLVAYGPLTDASGEHVFALIIQSETKDALIASITGVNSREAAEKLKGTSLYISRDSLPATQEDEFYYEDLIGIAVFLPDGAPYGKIKAVHDYGAGEFLEITREETGKNEHFSFTKRNFPLVDLAQRRVILELPEIVGDEAPND